MRHADVARARMWQVLTTDLGDLFGARPAEEDAPALTVPAAGTPCAACHGTGVAPEPGLATA